MKIVHQRLTPPIIEKRIGESGLGRNVIYLDPSLSLERMVINSKTVN